MPPSPSPTAPSHRVGVVLNPNARKNRGGGGDPGAELRRILGPWGEVHVTPDLAALRRAREGLVDRGTTYYVSDGGDGALHWLLNEIAEIRDRRGEAAGGLPTALPTVLPTNGGTIDFVARKVGVRGRAPGLVRRLTEELAADRPPAVVTVDSLALSGVQVDAGGVERPFRRIGFALAAGGIGRRFFDKYYEEADPRASSIVRIVARAVGSELARASRLPLPEGATAYAREVFRPTRARVTIDGEELPMREFGALHAGSFDVELGGVFHLFPFAREPGDLHFQAGDLGPAEMIAALPDLCRGRTIRSPNLRELRGREMHVEALGDELLAPIVDGEAFRRLRTLRVTRGPAVRVAKVVAG